MKKASSQNAKHYGTLIMIFSPSTSEPRLLLLSFELTAMEELLLKECCDIILSFMTAKATHSCLLNQVCEIEYTVCSKIILFLY